MDTSKHVYVRFTDSSNVVMVDYSVLSSLITYAAPPSLKREVMALANVTNDIHSPLNIELKSAQFHHLVGVSDLYLSALKNPDKLDSFLDSLRQISSSGDDLLKAVTYFNYAEIKLWLDSISKPSDAADIDQDESDRMDAELEKKAKVERAKKKAAVNQQNSLASYEKARQKYEEIDRKKQIENESLAALSDMFSSGDFGIVEKEPAETPAAEMPRTTRRNNRFRHGK